MMMQPRSSIAQMTVENTAATPLWQIFVPTVGNDGRPFSVRHHRRWDAHVKGITGGMTLVSPVRGSWVDPDSDHDFTERMIPVQISCTREQIIEICKETARFYDQLAVMAYLISDHTVLVTNPTAS